MQDTAMLQALKQMAQGRRYLQLLSRSIDSAKFVWNELFALSHLCQLLESDERRKKTFNPLFMHIMQQAYPISPHFIFYQYQRSAAAPGREYFLEGNIKTEGCKLQRPSIS